jgi:phytanoyl-CoA hydroxylase
MKKLSLSHYQVEFFRRSGYIKLDNSINSSLVEELLSSIGEAVDKQVKPYRENNGEIYRIDNLYDRNDRFKELIHNPVILEPLESLLGPNIEFTLNRHNHATLNIHNTHRLHRDILQWSRSVITAIVYLEDSNLENGCTEIIPSSHFLPFVGTPNNGGTWMDEHSVYKDLLAQALPIPMKKGGVLLFDSLAFHTVGKNETGRSRKSITLGYHSIDELSDDNSKYKVLVKGERLYRGNIKFEQ